MTTSAGAETPLEAQAAMAATSWGYVDEDEPTEDDEPEGAGVACECGSFLHGKC